jgi:hypothetical protein
MNPTRLVLLVALASALGGPARPTRAADPPAAPPPVAGRDAPRPEPLPPMRGAFVFHEKSAAPLPDGYRLLYEQDFDDATALQDFVFSDPRAWRLAQTNGLTALDLARQSRYQPAVRSPVNIALLAGRVFGDFILEVSLRQTGREYGHRDMCLFFGFQSPTNFYYAHLATAADDHAHNVFLVHGAPRAKIARETTQGVNWGLDVWHRVRLERTLADGRIRVFFDDLSKPIMLAEDKTFGAGWIGFGSFDDTGQVDKIRIWGPTVEQRPAGFFKRAAP